MTGYVIEDFEDLTLVPGLTASDGAFGLNSQSTFTNAVWDGTNYYVDQVLVGGGVNFSVAGGTSSFGIGLGDIDVAAVHLFVNDLDLWLDHGFAELGQARRQRPRRLHQDRRSSGREPAIDFGGRLKSPKTSPASVAHTQLW